MIEIGKKNKLRICKITDFGYYLCEGEDEDNRILLPFSIAKSNEYNVDDIIQVFVYKDSSDRLICTETEPLAEVGEIAYLEIVDHTRIGYFVDLGIGKDILVPFKEACCNFEEGSKYLFRIYVDKSERLAATSYINQYLKTSEEFSVDDEIDAIVYGFSENGNIRVAVNNEFKGIVLKNDVFRKVKYGEKLNCRVTKIFDNGTLLVTPRKKRLEEMDEVEGIILDYLMKKGGTMKYNDKSSPEEIKKEFKTSKNSFKRALGGLMKKKKITQDENGTTLTATQKENPPVL